MVKISAGDEGRVSQYGNEPDLGTAFALATSLFGNNQLQVSGNIAYSSANGSPGSRLPHQLQPRRPRRSIPPGKRHDAAVVHARRAGSGC